jgi:hypothetical protein
MVLYPLTTASFDIPISGMSPDVFFFRVVVGNLIVAPFILLCGMYVDKARRAITRSYLVAAVVFVFGAVRPLIMNVIEFAVLGTQVAAEPLRPLLTGATSFGLFLIVAIFANLRLEFLEDSRRYSEAESQLGAYQSESGAMLAEEEKRLGDVTRRRLEPVLRALDEQFRASKSTVDFRAALEELRDAIDNTVRPLTRYLAKVASEPARELPKSKAKPTRLSAIPNVSSLRQSWQPRMQLVLAGPIFVSLAVFEFGISHLIPSLVLVFSLWAIFEALRFLLPARNLPALVSLAFSGMLASAFWVSFFWLTNAWASALGTPSRLGGTPLSIIAASTLVFGLLVSATYIFQYNVVELREALVEKTAELRRSKALFEQRIWVARRNYTYMVHGDVQSLLSVALTRVRNAAKPTKAELTLIRSDLSKAQDLINRPLNSVNINLDQELEALAKTWQGACDVTFDISASARRVLLEDSNLAFCLNELAKEMVANAFRHGSASKISFEILLSADLTLDLVAVSNGQAPAPSPKKGVGLKMFDELSLSWSMTPGPKQQGARISLSLAR